MWYHQRIDHCVHKEREKLSCLSPQIPQHLEVGQKRKSQESKLKGLVRKGAGKSEKCGVLEVKYKRRGRDQLGQILLEDQMRRRLRNDTGFSMYVIGGDFGKSCKHLCPLG